MAEAKGLPVEDLTVAILGRERHEQLIARVRKQLYVRRKRRD